MYILTHYNINIGLQLELINLKNQPLCTPHEVATGRGEVALASYTL